MADGAEGASALVSGGTAARAVAPNAGSATAENHQQSGKCLNCGTALLGDYCHDCGQQSHVHRSLHAFWHDLAHSVLHFEGKIWRTLPLLALWPGDLTRRYIDGERARFVSPMALFLFSVFAMFAVFSFAGGPLGGGGTEVNFNQGMTEAIQQAEQSIADLERKRADAAGAGRETAEIDRQLSDMREEVSVLRAMQSRGITEASMVRASDDLPKELSWLNAPYKKARANPSLLFYKLQTNAYKFSWALIPLSVPFLWLLFPFSRRFRLYDHTVFVTYSLSFMTLLIVALTLLRAATGVEAAVVLALLFIPPVHMYRQLRGAYRLSRFSAFWRTVLLIVFAAMASGAFLALLLALGLLG